MLTVADVFGLSPEFLARIDEHRLEVLGLALRTFRELKSELQIDPGEADDIDAAVWWLENYLLRDLSKEEQTEAREFMWAAMNENARTFRAGIDDWEYAASGLFSWAMTLLDCVSTRASQNAIRASVRSLLQAYLRQMYGSDVEPDGTPRLATDPTTRPVVEEFIAILNGQSDLATPDVPARGLRPAPPRLGPQATWRFPPDDDLDQLREDRFSWQSIFKALYRVEASPADSEQVEELIDRLLANNHRLHDITWTEAALDYDGTRDVEDPLYGLTRLIDICIGGILVPGGGHWEARDRRYVPQLPGPTLLSTLASWLGATVPSSTGFHPFFHEVVEVVAATDPAASVEIVGELWPALMLGDLLLQRGGVRVRAGADVLSDAAATSPLLFCWWRPNREAMDASHGWGANSQWSTDFRRDFLTPSEFIYDADTSGRGWQSDLKQPFDLVRFRHATTAAIDRGDIELGLFAGSRRESRSSEGR